MYQVICGRLEKMGGQVFLGKRIMKFIRLAICSVFVLGTIVIWENCRDDIMKCLDVTSRADGVITVTDNKVIQADNAKKEKKQQAENSETGQADEITENTTSVKENELALNFEKGFESVAKKAMNSVVNIATMQLIETPSHDFPDIFRGSPLDDLLKDFDFFDFPYKKPRTRKANALGSGFIVRVNDDVMYIVTNNHVIDKAKKVVVYLSDKTELPAKIHATDARTDIAVLSVSLKELDLDRKKIVPIEWGDSSKINAGNFVVAVGNPFGLGNTVTHGIVSATGRDIPMGKTSVISVENFIQHSAPINMGNSGGALLDIKGRVIGINNAIFSTSGGNIGIGFAIPSNIAKTVSEQLIEAKRTYRGWLGTEVHPVTPEQAESVGLTDKHSLNSSKIYGAYVARVVPGGPAEKAGIKAGDIIIEFDEKKISENCSLQTAVSTAKIGNTVKVKIWRQKDSESWHTVMVDVKIGDFEEAMKNGEIDAKDEEGNTQTSKDVAIDQLGISVSLVPEKYKSEYPANVKVIISKVEEGSMPSMFGPLFEVGDGIISVNNQNVQTPAKVKEIVEKTPARKPVLFIIARDGRQIMITTTKIPSEETAESPKKNK